MKQYKVGDQVWWAHYGMSQVKVNCPICFGAKEVTLILGNGDIVVLLCEYCGKGWDGPRGYVTEWEYVAEAKLLTINEVRIQSRLSGEDVVDYSTMQHLLDAEDIFDTKEEALARALSKSAEETLSKETMAEHLKKNIRKSFAWNAGYHLRAARDARKSAEYHERMASICKSRSKSEPKLVTP